MGGPSGSNLYAYGMNDPLDGRDPSGTKMRPVPAEGRSGDLINPNSDCCGGGGGFAGGGLGGGGFEDDGAGILFGLGAAPGSSSQPGLGDVFTGPGSDPSSDFYD